MSALDSILTAWGAAFARPPLRAYLDHEGTDDEQVTVEGWIVYRCPTGWGLAVETAISMGSALDLPEIDLIPVGEWETLGEAVDALIEHKAATLHEVDPTAPV